jgi:hypothetical protein
MKVPQLRNLYQKTWFDDRPGAVSLDGFGFLHDGIDSTLFRFIGRPSFPNFANDTVRKTNLSAFMMCFDTGTAPAVGFTRTISSADLSNHAALNDWTLLELQASAGNVDLIAKGTIGGRLHGLLYRPENRTYHTDQDGLGPFTREQLQEKIRAGDTLSLTGVPPGSGRRMGIDRDLDDRLDADQPASQPLNVSARLRVQMGENVMIAGFIISGNAPKNVIIRAIGPSLGRDGVQEVLADPVLELHGPGGLITTNDDWREDATQAALIETSGVPPTSDSESAIVASLDPGNYTAVVRGNSQSAGIGLVEVYDLNRSADSRLANVSARGFVEAGENVMIGGFMLGGSSGSSRVIIRAVGPSLGRLGVANALRDPTLELHDANGGKVASNDDWKVNEQTGESQEAQVRATSVQPSDDQECAIVATLSPGNYSAIVRGKTEGTGVGLVEVFNLR